MHHVEATAHGVRISLSFDSALPIFLQLVPVSLCSSRVWVRWKPLGMDNTTMCWGQSNSTCWTFETLQFGLQPAISTPLEPNCLAAWIHDFESSLVILARIGWPLHCTFHHDHDHHRITVITAKMTSEIFRDIQRYSEIKSKYIKHASSCCLF